MRGCEIPATILAGAMALAGPLMAQTGGDSGELAQALQRADAARVRLDLPGALATLTAAIGAAPETSAPLLARAAIHRSMGRLSLALADLDVALEREPEDVDALAMRAETWQRAGAFDKAAADFMRARRFRPDDTALAAGAAAALAAAGRKSEALAASTEAVDLAPDDEALRGVHAALLADLADAARPDFVFESGALMGSEFTLTEGAETAPNRLIVVRDGAALTAKGAVRPDRMARAVSAGAVRITHVFTYSGQNSTIWANLALICAGPAFGATEAALISSQGRDALEVVDRDGDTGPLGALIAGAYALGGQDAAKVEDCALDRGLALRYLADWTTAQERIGWRGDTYLDHAPAYVLNGVPAAADWLDAWLAAQVPSSGAPNAEAGDADGLSPVPGGDAIAPLADDAVAAAVAVGTDDAAEPPEPATAPEPADTAPESPDSIPAPVIVADAALSRITLPPPVELAPAEGEAPERTATPAANDRDMDGGDVPEAGTTARDVIVPNEAGTRTDAGGAAENGPVSAMGTAPGAPETDPMEADSAPAADTEPGAPDVEPRPQPRPQPPDPAPGEDGAQAGADDVRLATLLKGIWAPSLAQCLAYLDAIKTPETLGQAMPDPAADPPLGAMLITSRRAQPLDASGLVCVAKSFVETGDESDAVLACTETGEDAGEMRLHAYPSGGPTPWLDVSRGEAETIAMRQCVTLGQLGVRFADLWQIDRPACTARVPMAGLVLEFRPEGDALWLTLRPPPDGAALPDPVAFAAAVDDVALTPGHGVLEAGAFGAPLGPFEDVARHLSLGMFLFLSGTAGTGFPTLRLPLLGSGRAMAALGECGEG